MISTTQDIATAGGIAEAAALLGTGPWKDETIRSALLGIRAPISEDFAWFSTEIEASLKSHNSRRAEDLLCLALQLAQKAFIEKIKARGHLRISRYRYEGEVLRRALTAVISRIGIHVTADTSDYLQSVIAITALSRDAMRVRSRLEATLCKRKSVALKSAYAELDLMFQMSEMNGRDPTSVEHSIERTWRGVIVAHPFVFRYGEGRAARLWPRGRARSSIGEIPKNARRLNDAKAGW